VFCGIAVSAWIGTGNMIIAVLVMDYAVATFPYQMHPLVMPILGIMNVFMFAVAYLWNPFTPHKTN
jgi:hypothetical protein